MAILKTEDLTYTYSQGTPFEKTAINKVNLEIEEGELVGVMGHTGSGKSTLIQHFNGLLEPTSGKVYLDGEDIWADKKKIRDVRFKVGLVFQYPEYQLFEETVYKDIAFGPKNMGIADDEIDKCVRDICAIIGVKEEHFNKSPFDLSGGEKRRVAIAGVMAMKPEIIIFDEPTSGLDPKGREDIIEIIKNYREATGATVIIISHNMEDMAVIADKLLVLNKGKLEMFDTVEKIFSNRVKLNSIGLDVPIVTRVFDELIKRGVDVEKDIFTVEKAIESLKKVKAGDSNA